MFNSSQPWTIGLILFYAVMIGWDVFSDWRERRLKRTGRDMLANVLMGAGSLVVGALVTGSILLVFDAVYALSPWHVPQTWWSWLLCIVLVDFGHYWAHRFSHEVRFGWASHVAHHSSQQYNFSVAVRQPWTHHYLFVFFLLPAALGFHPLMILAAKSFNSFYQFWLHTERIQRMPRWFEYIFNTPSHHRVHHGSNPLYIDKNHAGIFIIWDRLFGTYQEELAEEPVVYGITKNIESDNPLIINFHEYAAMAKDVTTTPGLMNKLRYMFHKPGWQPGDGPRPIVRKVQLLLGRG